MVLIFVIMFLCFSCPALANTLPNTGSIGSMPYYVSGSIIAVITAAVLVARSKSKDDEEE